MIEDTPIPTSEDILIVLQRGIRLNIMYAPGDEKERPAEGSDRDILFIILNTVTDNAAYLNGRRVKSKTLELDDEDALQDLLFIMLKPRFPSLTYEEPSRKGAASYPIRDFFIPELGTVIEAKYISKREDIKRVEREIADDLVKYSKSTDCDEIIFFVFDPLMLIPDRANFVETISQKKGECMIHGREIIVTTIVSPS